jgi:hypothetical protein
VNDIVHWRYSRGVISEYSSALEIPHVEKFRWLWKFSYWKNIVAFKILGMFMCNSSQNVIKFAIREF